MTPVLTNNQGRLTRDRPNRDVRSALQVDTGRYRMRNGHVALVTQSKKFPATSLSTGRPCQHIVWFGKCETCNEGCSWNANGTYAASGKHQFDLLEKL